MSKTLKFAARPRETLSLAAETDTLAATVRHDDEKGIESGDSLTLRSAETDEVIGTGLVRHVEEVPVQDALNVIRNWWAEYPIQQPDVLISTLNDYYTDTICRLSPVKVIILDPNLRGRERA